MTRHAWPVAAGLAAIALAGTVEAQERVPDDAGSPAKTSCLGCHADGGMFDRETIDRIVGAFRGGAHAEVELSCHDCHGGNPDPALSGDLEAAMDPGFEPNPYRGAPARREIPGFCGRCHSDPRFMRRYHPDPRVDQEREYRTSHHGRALESGDSKVAVCTSCHGTHGILGPDDPDSPVHPTRVAATCGRCHADAAYMTGYTTSDGRPLPVDQLVRWKRSVHAAAMFEKEDLTAPTCNDCHGNHGATPPGLDSIAFVCGQCHGREAELFRGSVKRDGFRTHNEYVAGLGERPCAECHDASEPQYGLSGIHSFSECATCHGNHAVVRPTLAMLGPLPDTPCAFCHEAGGPLAGDAPETGALPPEPGLVRRHYAEWRDALLATAGEQQLEGEELFDWMVDRALEVPYHSVAPAAGEHGEGATDETSRLRPEFRRLFEKFRIGKTYFTYEDPETGAPVRSRVRRCPDCHSRTPVTVDEPLGHETSGAFLVAMRELIGLTARAERITLAAQRGGVLVEDAALAVGRAVDAQIQLEVLVHTFDAGAESKFAQRHRNGIEEARSALDEAQTALDELGFRRRGLAISLVLIVLVLIGLALKIRQLGSD